MTAARQGYEGMSPIKQTPVPKKTYQPFGSLIAVHLLRDAEVPGGLVLPQQQGVGGQASITRDSEKALVIAAGPDCKQVKEGDIIILAQGIPTVKCRHLGHETNTMREDHITGIVMNEEYYLRRGTKEAKE